MKAFYVFLFFVFTAASSGVSGILGTNFWYFPDEMTDGQWNAVERAISEKMAFIGVSTLRLGGTEYDLNQPSETTLRRFFDLCEGIGATPIVQIPFNGKVPEDGVRFVGTVLKMWDGDILFSIGSDPDIYTELSSIHPQVLPMEEAVYLERYSEFLALIKEKHPDSKMIGPDLSWKWRTGPEDNWLEDFLERNGEDIYAVTVHRYPFGGTESIADLLADPTLFSGEMEFLDPSEIRAGVTETNLTWNRAAEGPFSPKGFFSGLWMASVYGRALSKGLWNFSVWSAANDDLAMMDVTPYGVGFVYPVYYAFAVYRNFGDLERSYESDYLDIHIGRNGEFLRVVIVNRSNEKIVLDLSGSGRTPTVVPGFSFGRVVIGADGKTFLEEFFTEGDFSGRAPDISVDY